MTVIDRDGVIEIVPDDGKTLTKGETYSKSVYLGVNDRPENWHEIPDENVPERQDGEQASDDVDMAAKAEAYDILMGG